MSKINLTYDKTEYTLEYSRQSVKTMEAHGFILDELTTKPMTMIPMLFEGAFIKNHVGVKRREKEAIFDSLSNKTELMAALMEMYAETLSSLTEDSADNEGNVAWAKVE